MVNKLMLVLVLASTVKILSAEDIAGRYGYLKKYAIPAAERIRRREAAILNGERIVGGSPSGLGKFPYQVGIIADVVGLSSPGVCSGSLLTSQRVLTSAGCWDDGAYAAWRFTIVAGSTFLFSGGTRVRTAAVAVHDRYILGHFRYDAAVAYLPIPIEPSANVAFVTLSSGSLINKNFTGQEVVVAGYGLISDDSEINDDLLLNHATLKVMSTTTCRRLYPELIQYTHFCTSGEGGGPCIGDAGGPVIFDYNGQPTQIGIVSVIYKESCERGIPTMHTRIEDVIDFIETHI